MTFLSKKQTNKQTKKKTTTTTKTHKVSKILEKKRLHQVSNAVLDCNFSVLFYKFMSFLNLIIFEIIKLMDFYNTRFLGLKKHEKQGKKRIPSIRRKKMDDSNYRTRTRRLLVNAVRYKNNRIGLTDLHRVWMRIGRSRLLGASICTVPLSQPIPVKNYF